GELDTQSSSDLFATLREVNRETGVKIVVLTHDPLVAEQVQRTILIRDGRTATETLRRLEVGSEGEELVVAEELAVLDRTGRLQLPPDYIAALTLERRAPLALRPHRRAHARARRRAGARARPHLGLAAGAAERRCLSPSSRSRASPRTTAPAPRRATRCATCRRR